MGSLRPSVSKSKRVPDGAAATVKGMLRVSTSTYRTFASNQSCLAEQSSNTLALPSRRFVESRQRSAPECKRREQPRAWQGGRCRRSSESRRRSRERADKPKALERHSVGRLEPQASPEPDWTGLMEPEPVPSGRPGSRKARRCKPALCRPARRKPERHTPELRKQVHNSPRSILAIRDRRKRPSHSRQSQWRRPRRSKRRRSSPRRSSRPSPNHHGSSRRNPGNSRHSPNRPDSSRPSLRRGNRPLLRGNPRH
jgi:hypothetical protein